MGESSSTAAMPAVPDHELLRIIASGSFGQVWLARNVMGTFRAAKIVYRKSFADEQPYLREFDGIRHYEPVSRSHPALVAIFHIGRDEAQGLFYYLMELADPLGEEPTLDPAVYRARTLASEIKERQRLPLNQCVSIGKTLAAGLGYLHQRGLIHRDIKPSNIIFVGGKPKLADVGLVTPIAGRTGTYVGTDGYLPPEGPGTPGADLFALGKVLYEISTGKDRMQFPDLPTVCGPPHELEAFRAWNDAVLRACDPAPRKRFASARQLFDALARIPPPTAREEQSRPDWWSVVWPEQGPPEPIEQFPLEAVGGAVPLDSVMYVEREADTVFGAAVSRGDSILLVKGARQMGKTSLLARGLHQARQEGSRVVLTDLQELNGADLESLKRVYLAFGEALADQLQLEARLRDEWDEELSANRNLERYVRRRALGGDGAQLFWGLDEADRLFATPFGGEVFGLLRAWHNKRALDPNGPWNRLTLAIAYATEAHLFITDLNQSPFNVGTRISLDDFTFDQVTELNRRHGSPLRAAAELRRFYELVSGHPYLVRRGLFELRSRSLKYEDFEASADREDGAFGDHLRRMLISLRKDSRLEAAARSALANPAAVSAEDFYRLRSAGLLAGEPDEPGRARCLLYDRFLRRNL